MHREIGRAIVICVCVAMSAPAFADGNTLTIRVSAVRSGKGAIRCRLYSKPDGFPGKDTYEMQQSAPIVNGAAVCTFVILPATYAVSVFHDENGDGQLDKNFIGIPTEGVGVSNNRLRSMGPPKWEDAKFVLRGDLTLEVKLRY